jgi:hypothetical protein
MESEAQSELVVNAKTNLASINAALQGAILFRRYKGNSDCGRLISSQRYLRQPASNKR